MFIRLDAESPVGLAEQIAGQVRGAVIAGSLEPGERLPPARQLADSLDVNMHTVLKAYAALRDERLIELRRGRGAHVRSDVDTGAAGLDDQIRALVAESRRLGLSTGQLLKRLREAAT